MKILLRLWFVGSVIWVFLVGWVNSQTPEGFPQSYQMTREDYFGPPAIVGGIFLLLGWIVAGGQKRR